MARPTIKDISRIAGVSPTAVSFALNDRPGVSDATRARIEQVARELGWQRSVAAAALSAGRAQAIGLIIARPTSSFTGERFFMFLLAGIEQVLTSRSLALVLQFVDTPEQELEAYRQWHFECRVDGVVLIDPRADDPRPAMLQELGLPAVFLGAQRETELPGVRVDDASAMRMLVDHLHEQGHQRLAHVPGTADLVHTQERVAAFAARCGELGIEVCPVEATDYTEAAGRAATRGLLSLPTPPTGIVYDNEVLTLGGLTAIASLGVKVPDEVAVASFEDSPLCRMVQPSVTALKRDPSELGAHATKLLLDVLDGKDSSGVVEPSPRLEVRGSTQRA